MHHDQGRTDSKTQCCTKQRLVKAPTPSCRTSAFRSWQQLPGFFLLPSPRTAGRAFQGAVTKVRRAACAGRSELTAIVGVALAAVLLIAAVVIVALVWCKKGQRDKRTSKR